ncbi:MULTISPECIES: hypothetical protein [unclassified Achromobacter]|uniref:DUF7940 domain-containing protein n=1 Tax=unclassified Achromobacter TaxID=2626865 RepID=UPI000B516B7C|nr:MULTISPECIES: hypothetical protein [unclassified Achromobacter]OWT68098.1 hypothetical protein CEY05_29125 [Achromobacter sp. HZ34]OWT69935.1 hypothetical protein CEY04_27955 [Achromobacter sp. HZ28]
MKIPLIDDVHRLFKFYSVWAMLAILLVSIAEALMALYVPADVPHALGAGIVTALLAIIGIGLRAWKQGPRDGE